MKAPAMRRVLLARVMFPVAVMAAGTLHAEQVSRKAAADPKGEVSIVNVAGSVEVVGWDRAEVQVDADLGSNVERLDFKTEGTRTIVKVVLPRMGGSSGASDLTVKIPRDSSLNVNTVSADQNISGVRGAQRLQAVSGGIETELGTGDLEAKTVSGSILARGTQSNGGSVRAATVSGDVQLDKIGPEVELNTVSGDMNVRMDSLTLGRIKTTNGNLELRTALAKDARIEAEAINGDVRFTLGGQIDAEFDIETFNGDIDNCFGPKPSRTREHGPGNELRFTQGKGAAHVRIKTLNGAVGICQR
jgi:DUF4097 and DUF4098 domain-containing protein YvlB